MNKLAITVLAVVGCCTGSMRMDVASAAEPLIRSMDVALGRGGVLVGQVVNTEGQPLGGAEVVLKANGQEMARGLTDEGGHFQVAGLKGGPVEVSAVGVVGNCRIWAPGTAPPAAQQGLLVVSPDDVVRGQHMNGRGRRVNCGQGVQGHGGGLLGLMIDHPVVTAGAIGAAIAIPIAVANNGDPSSP